MFKRRLQALKCPAGDNLNANNEIEFRSVIIWLEDRKIRQYKIEDRKYLRDVESESWPEAFAKYKVDVGCPIKSGIAIEEMQWMLDLAVRLDYGDNKEQYRQALHDMKKFKVPIMVYENSLDSLNFHSQVFKNGINRLASILKISPHPDHLVTLRAIRKIVCKRLNPEALQNPETVIIKGVPYPFEEAMSGIDLGDPVLNQAAKIFRLLHIQSERELQTKINEIIVSVQGMTANPKTDTKLGRAGKK